MKRTIRLNFQPGEGKLVGLLAAHYFFLGAASVFTQSMAFAAFLNQFGPSSLPYMYMAMPVGASLVAYIYLKIGERTSISKLLVGNLAFIALGSFLLRVGLLFPGFKALIFFLPIWFQILANMTTLALWSLAGRLMDLRQGKRLLGLVGSGNWVAIAAAGLLVTPIVAVFGAANLLVLAGISLLISIAFQLVLIRRYGERLKPGLPQKPASQRPGKTPVSPLKSRYAQLIILLVIIWWVGFFFIDNIFNTGAAAQFPDATQLTGMLGNIYAVIGVLGLIVTTFISGPLISRFGMRTTLLILPVLLLVPLGGLAIVGVANATVVTLFWLATTGKVINSSLGFTLDQTSRSILYQPLPPAQRTSVQTMAEAIVQPLAIGLAGVLLLIFSTLLKFTPVQLSLVFLVIALTWIGIVFALRKEYPIMLVRAIARHHLTGFALPKADSTTLEVIRKGFSSPSPQAAIYSLDLISQADPDGYPKALLELIQHPALEVRQEALQRLEENGDTAALPAIRRLLGRETQPQVRAAAIRALASLGGSDAYADIQAYYDDPVLLNRQAALIGSLRGGSQEGLSAASQRVLRLSKSGTAVDRSLAAVVFGEAGDHQFTQPLRDLLMDVDYTVRRKALNSAAQLKSLELWPLVVENLSLPRSRRAALCALWKGDEAVLAEIRKEFAREDTSPAVLALLAKACGRIAGPGAIEILQTRLDDPRPDVRTQVLLGLKRCGYQASAEMDIKIQEKIRDEAEYAAWLSALTSPIAQDSRANILREALGDQLNLSRERIFCLLSYIYPRDLILKAQEALQRSTAEQAANALEALEVALPQGLKAIILPVIEDLEPAQRHTRLQSTFPQPAFTLHQSLIELTNPDRQVSSWIRSCAEHVSTHLESPSDGGSSMLSIVEKVIILKSVSIFSEIPSEILAEIAQVSSEVEAEAGKLIFSQGDLGDSLYVVVDGCVRVHDGNHTLNTLGTSEVFGEMALLDPAPRLASVTAEDDTRLLRIDQESFFELMEDQPQVAQGVIRVLTRRLRDRVKDLDQLRSQSAPVEAE